jgi:hypothetical protein
MRHDMLKSLRAFANGVRRLQRGTSLVCATVVVTHEPEMIEGVKRNKFPEHLFLFPPSI